MTYINREIEEEINKLLENNWKGRNRFYFNKGDKVIPIEVKTSRRISKGSYTFINSNFR